MNTRRNKYDNRDSLEMGESAESRFRNHAMNIGWEVEKSTKTEDIDKHWDFTIIKDDREYKVDVKSRKRLSRHDNSKQDKWVWVELHGVRQNDPGWLYGGNADLISFETRYSFVIIERHVLIELVDKLVDKDKNVNRSKNAMYKVYSRRGRPDLLSLIEISKIKPHAWDEWQI